MNLESLVELEAEGKLMEALEYIANDDLGKDIEINILRLRLKLSLGYNPDLVELYDLLDSQEITILQKIMLKTLELEILLFFSEYSESNLKLKETLKLVNQIKKQQKQNSLWYVLFLQSMTAILESQGKLKEALRSVKNSIEITQHLNNRRFYSKSLFLQASVYDTKGDLDKALEIYFQAKEIQQELELRLDLASTLYAIDVVYARKAVISRIHFTESTSPNWSTFPRLMYP